MIDSIFKILGATLSIWEHKERRKYLDKYIRLKREYYEAYNEDPRDDALLDNIEFELKLFVDAISSEAQKPDSKNK